MDKTISKKITSIKEKYDLDDTQIAAEIGVGAMTVYRWINMNSHPRAYIIKKALEKFLNKYG